MNGQHLRAFFWLQSRLRINQIKRGGTANLVFYLILVVGAVLMSITTFAGCLLLGFALADAEPAIVMYAWDAVVVGFLFFWLLGLMGDLQRSEALSLEKFLHLPVSPSGVFVLNYLTSLLSLTLIVFVPAMAGLGLGLIVARGAWMLLLVPLVLAFLLMVTAVTYQFQGWLASLMSNKRRRRTVVVLVSAVFLMVVQLPNLINIYQPWRSGPDELAASMNQEEAELRRALSAKEITGAEYQQRQAEVHKNYLATQHKQTQQTLEKVERIARLVNMALPPGWLPLGATAAAEGSVLPPLLGIAGMSAIGMASLWRGYRTTVRLYTGQFTSGKRAAVPVEPALAAALPNSEKPRAGLLDKTLPWISEPASAIALGGFRSLTRAPEAKMVLLTPIIMVAIFGGMFFRGAGEVPPVARPFMVFGGLTMILFTLVQLVGNQFGYDRGGFRVFVLGPAPRHDILLGKNLAVAPIVLILALLVLGLFQVASPLPWDYLLATFPQMISMYLVFCVVANALSILAPLGVAAGSLKSTNSRVIPVLLHMVFALLLPLAVAPMLLPLGIELLLGAYGLAEGWPICLLLSLLQCVAIAFLYRWILKRQGAWLQSAEQRILEIVTTKAQ